MLVDRRTTACMITATVKNDQISGSYSDFAIRIKISSKWVILDSLQEIRINCFDCSHISEMVNASKEICQPNLDPSNLYCVFC